MLFGHCCHVNKTICEDEKDHMGKEAQQSSHYRIIYPGPRLWAENEALHDQLNHQQVPTDRAERSQLGSAQIANPKNSDK